MLTNKPSLRTLLEDKQEADRQKTRTLFTSSTKQVFEGLDGSCTIKTGGGKFVYQDKHIQGARRNGACPCGSGIKFKRCCRTRKLGRMEIKGHMSKPFVVRDGAFNYLQEDGAWGPNEDAARGFDTLDEANSQCHAPDHQAFLRSPESKMRLLAAATKKD